MSLPSNQRTRIFDAAALGVEFNSPLGAERATRLVKAFSERVAGSVVDLGCGTGALTRAIAAKLPTRSVRGIDSNAVLVSAAMKAAELESSTAVFEHADATSWVGPGGGAVCVGASHAFGTSSAMFEQLTRSVPAGALLIGDAFWQTNPDRWCLEAFGELPRSVRWFEDLAQESGWSIVDSSTSTTAEWDNFERDWCAGALLSDGSEAVDFVAQRSRDYEHYRGVLGFCWLVLDR